MASSGSQLAEYHSDESTCETIIIAPLPVSRPQSRLTCLAYNPHSWLAGLSRGLGLLVADGG